MAVPKRKTSPSRRGMRRSADALKKPAYVEDKDSGELRRPHHIDLKTGKYKGRQGLAPKKVGAWSGAGSGSAAGDGTIYLVGFPLLLIPFVLYNLFAFLFGVANWNDQI